MKKLLKAFTLAEILITLTILGVIASVTLPTLNTNTQIQVTETSLAKAINTLESVNERIQTETNSKRISVGIRSNRTAPVPNDYLPALENYLNGSFRQQTIVINGNNRNVPTFTTKDGIMFTTETQDRAVQAMDADTLANKYFSKYSMFVIDINGTRNPNLFGRDQFLVIMDDYGAVIPWGSVEYGLYRRRNANSEEVWTTSCTSNSSVRPRDPRSCAGAISDNGFKILYGYNLIH